MTTQNNRQDNFYTLGTFYIITIFTIKRTKEKIIYSISLANRSCKKGIEFIIENIVECQIIEDMATTTLLEIKKIINRLYKTKYIPNYYIVSNVNIKNCENEKLKHEIIAKSNFVKYDKVEYKKLNNSLADISTYVQFMYDLSLKKIQQYNEQENKIKYEGIIT